jgi:hypothetical protein
MIITFKDAVDIGGSDCFTLDTKEKCDGVSFYPGANCIVLTMKGMGFKETIPLSSIKKIRGDDFVCMIDAPIPPPKVKKGKA